MNNINTEQKRQVIIQNLRSMNHSVSYSKSKRRITVKSGDKFYSAKMHFSSTGKIAFIPNGYALANHDSIYEVYKAMDKVCGVPEMCAACNKIEEFLAALRTQMRAAGIITKRWRPSDRPTNGMNLYLEKSRGSVHSLARIVIEPNSIGFEVRLSFDKYHKEYISYDHIELDSNIITELLCENADIDAILHGPVMKPFVEIPLIVKEPSGYHLHTTCDKHIYHGTLLSASIMSVVAMDGSKITTADCVKPGTDAFFVAEVTVTDDYRPYVSTIITNGEEWGEVYRGAGSIQVVLPDRELDLTLTDKELIGKAIAYHIDTERDEDSDKK